MKLFLASLVMFGAMVIAVEVKSMQVAQEPATKLSDITGITSTGSLHMGTNVSKESVRIYSFGDKMFEVTDAEGKTTFTVMKDGSVRGDVSKLDENAKRFWELMAKYMPEFCKEVK